MFYLCLLILNKRKYNMDKKTTTIIYNDLHIFPLNRFENTPSVDSRICWNNNKLNILIENKNEKIYLNDISVKNKQRVDSTYELYKGIHNLEITPAFCDRKIIRIENDTDIIEHIILDTNVGFNKWILNFDTGMMLEPMCKWKYKSVLGIWNENALWKTLEQHNEFLSSINEIEWLISRERESDIEDLLEWSENLGVNSMFTFK